jgi:hypothetical protein
VEFCSPACELSPDWGCTSADCWALLLLWKEGHIGCYPRIPVNKSEFSATSCLAYCSCTSKAVAKLSGHWVGGSTGADVINPLNVLTLEFTQRKLASRWPLWQRVEGCWPGCPHQGGWINQERVVDRPGREQLFPGMGEMLGTGLVSIQTSSL